MSKETPERAVEETQVGYAWIYTHWTKLLATARYVITQAADEAVEIVARIVMLAAPMPNAISVYNVVQKPVDAGGLGFTPFQALAFAFTIEVLLFLLIEVALQMLTRWIDGQGIYKWAFSAMVGVVAAATGIVINLVYTLEPHKVMAWMPVLSLCSFVAIGLKRWDQRNQERVVSGVKPVKRSVKLGVNRVSNPTPVDTPALDSGSVNPAAVVLTPRQLQVLQYLETLQDQPAESVNKSALARQLNVSRPTIISDINALQSLRVVDINGVVKVDRSKM